MRDGGLLEGGVDEAGVEADAVTRRPSTASIVVAVVSVGIGAAVLFATASGLGVSPDGVAYLSLAEELRSNGSPYAVLAPSPTHYAPLWAMVVGGLSALTSIDDLLGIGRVVNAVTAAAIPPLVYLAVRRSPMAPGWWAALAAATTAVSFGLFRLSVRALTEPLFIALVVLALLLVEVGRRRHSRRLVFTAALVAAGATMTRYAGVALVVPLAVAAATLTPRWPRRAVDIVSVGSITVVPTLVWAALAPTTTTSTHLDSGDRAGLGDLVQSLAEAGYALVDPPTSGFARPLYVALGVAAVIAPIVAGLVATRHDPERTATNGLRRAASRLDRLGLAPWLLFLVGYALLVSAQRWWIGREVIDRYWVPYIAVALIVVARVVADAGWLAERGSRRVAAAIGGALAAVNIALIVAFVTTRAGDGIELNEVRYQRSEVLDAIRESDVDVVLTDSVRLVELHVLTPGNDDVPVTDIGCAWSGQSRVVELAGATSGRVAVLLADVCDRTDAVDGLQGLDGGSVAAVISEPGVGTLVLLERP